MTLRTANVFTPNDFPVHTYVERGGAELEQRLQQALDTPKAVVSVSGPSKSGKTVLIERVVSRDNLIVVSGAEIKAPDDLWNRILDWMGSPSSTSKQSAKGSSDKYSANVSGRGGIPGFISGGGQAGIGTTENRSTVTTASSERAGLAQVQREIGESDFIVLIDDFHYMPRDVQVEVARQIKSGAERGIRFCVASVPHRSDDVVRSNPELRGRTTNIDSSFWTIDELKQIALLGFEKIGAKISDEQVVKFAEEACGSPQLMQSICLHACARLGIDDDEKQLPLPLMLTPTELKAVFEVTSSQSDYSSLVNRMHGGPKIRGTERKVHKFRDDTTGDVYRCILLVITEDPPRMSLSWGQLNERIRLVCTGDTPAGSSIKEACRQISNIAVEMYPEQRIVEWDDEADILSVVDPYFLFYMRSSPKLGNLAK